MLKIINNNQKIVASINSRFFNDFKNKVFKVISHEILSDTQVELELISINENELVHGVFSFKDFDYHGYSINNEILNLIENNNVKSFNAVLEDGRVVSLNCLN